MTQDEIIRMAREAGLLKMIQVKHVVDKVYEIPSEKLERFAALVAAHEREACAVCPSWDTVDDAIAAEREACAKVCSEMQQDFDAEPYMCAAAIRARK